MKKLLVIDATIVATTFSITSQAQFAKPEAAAKYRQSAMFIMAQHFGRVGAMVQGKVPFDAKVAQENIDTAVFMSKLPWAGFVAGADSKAAKPEIWTDNAKFKDLSEKMQAQLLKVQAAAKTGSLDNIKASFGAAGGSCKACHDAFRNE